MKIWHPGLALATSLVIALSSCAGNQGSGTPTPQATPSPEPTPTPTLESSATPPCEPSPTPQATPSPEPPSASQIQAYLADGFVSAVPSPNGNAVIVLTTNGMMVFDLNTSAFVWASDVEEGTTAAWSPTDDLIAAGQRNGTVLLLDSSTGTAIGQIVEGNEEIKTLAFSPDGSALAIAYGNLKGISTELLVWDVHQQKSIRWLTDYGFGEPVWSPDSNLIALVIYLDVALFSPRTGVHHLFASGERQVMRALWLGDGTQLLVERDGGVEVWDVSSKQQTAHYPTRLLINGVQAYDSHALIALSGEPIILWNYITGEESNPLGNEAVASEMALDQSANLLAIALSSNSAVRIWNLDTYDVVGEFSLESDQVIVGLEWSGDWLLTTIAGGQPFTYNIDSSQLIEIGAPVIAR
jgi:WD40 repeat protein